MAFVIIDLEFNNLSGIHKCYPNIYNEIPGLKELELINEIIEVGAVKVDMHLKPISELRVYIKPKAIPILNPNILQITGIKENELKSGISFVKAIDSLRKMIDDDDIICSWAKDDIVEIIRNAHYHGYTDLNWIKQYLDLQEYTTKVLGFKKSLSLSNALKQLKIKYDNEKLHDALNDAKYESQVFKAVYNSRAVKKYIIEDIFNMPALEIKSLNSINIDYDRVKEVCPRCNLKIAIDYNFMVIGWRFVSMGVCPRCNNKVLNELIIKKSLSGDYIYKEINSIVSEIEYSRVENRIKAKRKEEKVKFKG